MAHIGMGSQIKCLRPFRSEFANQGRIVEITLNLTLGFQLFQLVANNFGS